MKTLRINMNFYFPMEDNQTPEEAFATFREETLIPYGEYAGGYEYEVENEEEEDC